MQQKKTLNNGVLMPVIGLGVWQMAEGQETRQAVLWALEAGYRLIDTSPVYGNEREVGEAVQISQIYREEIFITTKLDLANPSYENTLQAIDLSLSRIGTQYVDLYLIHWPARGFGAGRLHAETWRAMEEIYRTGKAKSIGVSNYDIPLLQAMNEYADIPPAVNQVEFNPSDYQKDLLEYCQNNKVALEAYSPLMRGRGLGHKKILAIAERYHKTPAQVVMRWNLQHGTVVIPKSSHKERIYENMDIFDFELDPKDMATLDHL